MKKTNKLKIKKILLVICGTIALILGSIGVFLPLLPTTPFLLLSAACFFRSSEKYYKWLINNRFFGKIIKDYREKKGIPLGLKTASIALLWLTISYSAFHFVEHIWVRVVLLLIALSVTIHLLMLKTIRKDN